MGGVRTRYNERVASGTLTEDAAQAGAATRLDELALVLANPLRKPLF